MLKKLRNSISQGIDWQNTLRKRISLAEGIKIKNKLLAKELALACKQQQGTLTYAEYLAITQFGNHGYYVTSRHHAKTDVETRWGTALALYCQKNNYTTVIEFGCGTGELGATTAKAYTKHTNKRLSWIGVELDTTIHPKILQTFKQYQTQDALEFVTDSLDNITPRESTLIVFPYSLDNIPPHVFINTTEQPTFPNSLLGIRVENNRLSEVILPLEALQQKAILLKNGYFTTNNETFSLTSWKLRRGQRAYIATDAFSMLAQLTKKWQTKTNLLIIDEFRQEPWTISPENLGTPRSLYEHNLLYHDRIRYYQESGKHNFYYPIYQQTLTTFLHAIGFMTITTEIEQKQAAKLQEKTWIPIKKSYSTLAYTATNWKEKNSQPLPITFSPKRVF